MSIYKKLLVTASLTLSVVAVQSKSIEAATIAYDFRVDVTTGQWFSEQYLFRHKDGQLPAKYSAYPGVNRPFLPEPHSR